MFKNQQTEVAAPQHRAMVILTLNGFQKSIYKQINHQRIHHVSVNKQLAVVARMRISYGKLDNYFDQQHSINLKSIIKKEKHCFAVYIKIKSFVFNYKLKKIFKKILFYLIKLKFLKILVNFIV